jgi:glycerophosphoryl diester phosphodiesterase
MTKDGVLVARHENEIGATTDVAERPEFAARKTSKVVDGTQVSGWFSEDFTAAELKTLRARERIPRLRPGNARFDRMFEVPTLEEILVLLRTVNEGRKGRPVGVYPETKHPSYFATIGLAMEEPLVSTLERHGYTGRDAPVFIQSFEVANLKRLARMTQLPLVQLIDASGRPYDFVAAGNPRTYAYLATPPGLAEIAGYARGIGVHKSLLTQRLVSDAHAKGLFVHGWTFRAENEFLPAELRSGTDATAHGNLAAELDRYLKLGIDGFFIDQPEIGARARKN